MGQRPGSRNPPFFLRQALIGRNSIEARPPKVAAFGSKGLLRPFRACGPHGGTLLGEGVPGVRGPMRLPKTRFGFAAQLLDNAQGFLDVFLAGSVVQHAEAKDGERPEARRREH